MLNNQTRRQILSEARQTGFQGSVLDLFQLAEQGADVSGMLQTEAQARQQQQQMQVAQTAKIGYSRALKRELDKLEVKNGAEN